MSKSKKIAGIIFAFIIVVALAVGIYYFVSKGDKSANAVMECSVNPNVQFVLNSKDKVIAANALNADGEKLIMDTNFEGMSAEDCAKLFVELSTEAGYINVSTSGTRVDITIYASEEEVEKFDALKTKVTNKVNAYFDENGIIAGAVTSIHGDMKEALTNLGVKASDLAEATEEDLKELINTTSNDLKDISVTLRDTLNTTIDGFVSLAQAGITLLENQLETAQGIVDNLSGQAKVEAQETLDEIKQNLKEAKDRLAEEIEEAKELVRTQSEAILKQAKEDFETLKTAGKTILENHKEAYLNNKDYIKAQIDAYRESLETLED